MSGFVAEMTLRLRKLTSAARVTRDQCYDFKNIFDKNLAKKLAVFAQNKAKLCKKLIITLVLEKNANFSQKICENSSKL
jgi:hypothetical protein